MFGKKKVQNAQAELYREQAMLLMDREKFEQAIGPFEKSLEINGKQHDVLCNLGTCYMQATVQDLLNNNGAFREDAIVTFDIAESYFKKAMEQKKNSPAKGMLEQLRAFRNKHNYY